jgi:tetratricopeptide (TPR) repeat protein
LKFYLDKTDEAYKEYLEIITGIEDYVRQKTSYINFIKLQNDLLKVQIDINRNIVNEYWEQYLFMKELFDQVKSENVILANKLGLNLFNILCRLKKYDECIPLLSQMKKILNDKIYSGHNLKSSIDYSLAIFSRMAYIGTIIGDKETVIEARKKLVQILETIKNDKNNPKLVSLYNAYNLCVSILNIYLGIFDNQLKENAAIFKESFIPNDGFILNIENRDFTLINLNSINNMDAFLNKFTTEIICSYELKLKKNNLLNSDQFLGYIVHIHNNISRLSESYCTDTNVDKRKDYIWKINEYHNIIFNYVRLKIGNERLLECDFVKSLLVDIQQACVSANFCGKHLDKVKNLIIIFDQLKKELKINEKTTSYELINKTKGDYWFKTGDYLSAISYYTKTIDMMKDNNPKKPIVYFNLGCAYFLYKKKKNAIDNLNLCINAYRTFEYEQKTFDVLTRSDSIMKKVKNVKRLLSYIENKKN